LQNRAFSLSAPIGFRTSPDILLTKLEEAAEKDKEAGKQLKATEELLLAV